MAKVILLGHETKIESIRAIAGNLRSPWYKDDQFNIYLSFDGATVAGCYGFGILLPMKEYSPEEFLKAIESEGERVLKEIIRKREDDKNHDQAMKTRQAELDRVASRLQEALGVSPK